MGVVMVWMAASPRPAWAQWSGTNPVWTNSNAGIGTSTPGSIADFGPRLHVRGTTPSDGGHWTGRVIASGPSYAVVMGELAGVASLGGHNAALSAWANLVLQPAGGNVGVGMTNPQSKLAVNGNITAKDVMVTNTGWSDYVFQPGYRLPPLREVGAFIQANHHLPGIPSEAEVKAKGVSLGDMQAKLLAKVEELTLHMIQADERNNRLDEQNRELRDRLARLEQGAAGATPAAVK